ncbi:MAG: D-glycerate dehydrogenase [Bacteroidota bacterium]
MNVLITRRIPQKGIELLEAAGHTLTIYSKQQSLSQEALINLCKNKQAILSVGFNKLDVHFFEQCKHLTAVSLMSAGYDNVDVHAANKYGVPVSNTRGVLSKATSDVAFLLMLSVSRNAFNLHKKIERNEWGFFEPTADLGIELYGKTLGIFGLGGIGMELAKKAKAAYQMNIIYHNRNRNTEAEDLLDAHYVSFNELLAQSDVLSVHANLSAATKELFNETAFKQMKSSAIFINTARGAIHNEQDLIDALQHQIIWGAGLDVTNPEPMAANNILLNLPNVCVLPHIGSATIETRTEMAVIAAKNIIAALNNEPMPQQILL